MLLDLREIIESPAGSLPFELELDVTRLCFPSIIRYITPVTAAGKIQNSAGALSLECKLVMNTLCICDRCLSEFEKRFVFNFITPLATELQDEESPDIILIKDKTLDLQELLSSLLLLDMDAKCLCAEDCAGLCEHCGANLNNGRCECPKKPDPRLAVLEQLLDK